MSLKVIIIEDVVKYLDDVGPQHGHAAELLNHAHQHHDQDRLVHFRGCQLARLQHQLFAASGTVEAVGYVSLVVLVAPVDSVSKICS